MKTPISTTHLQAFAHDLHEARQRKGRSQSDLARRMWGERMDERGYKVARNRDPISVHEKGKAAPGATADALAPGLLQEIAPAVQMTVIEGHPDKVRLLVNTTIPFQLAAQIVALLSQSGTFTSHTPATDEAPSNGTSEAG